MSRLTLQLDVTGLRALVVGEDPAGEPVVAQLVGAGMEIVRVEGYRRQYLTPRPALVVLCTRDGELAGRVGRDAKERGIWVVDAMKKDLGSSEARIPPAPFFLEDTDPPAPFFLEDSEKRGDSAS